MRLLGQYQQDVEKSARVLAMLQQAVRSLQEEFAERDATETNTTFAASSSASMSPPMSIERRRLVLAGTSILKALGHAGFDRMLLELGVPEDVGAGSGLLARSTSLGRYALSNPDAKAYDGSLLTAAVIRRAQDLFDRGVMANLTEQDRLEFEQAYQNAQERPNAIAPAATTSVGYSDGWRQKLAKELEAAGFTMDWAKLA